MNSVQSQKVTTWFVAAFFTALSVFSPFSAGYVNGEEAGLRKGRVSEEIFIGEESITSGSRSRTLSPENSSLVVYHLYKPGVDYGDFRIEAMIEGEAPVKKATIFYRVKGNGSYKKARMNKVSGNTFEGTIPVKNLSEAGIEYYILATDKKGNTGYDGSNDIPYFAQISAASGVSEKRESVKSKKSNWWKWALGAAVIGGAAAALSSSSSSSSGNSTGGDNGGGSSDTTGKVTGIWR